MELQPRVKYSVAVPFDGLIGSVPKGAEAGRPVHQGDLLVQMDTQEANLRLLDSQAKLNQALKERDENQKNGKLAEAKQAEFRAQQAQATLDLARYDLDRSRIVSPIDGMIIAGDLSDKIGAAVKTGELLFQVAPLEDMVVVARVSDRDIGLVHGEYSQAGPTGGDIATKAFPARTFPFVVERIVPLALPKDGKNAFEVRGRLSGSAEWLKPGMEGYAHFDTGKHSLMWIGTRRIRDQLRLWLWW
jgi:multidrug efflux pump subunit AcrA (membrane-fusion protein)